MFRKKEPLIKLISTVDGLTLVNEAIPKKASALMPDWWKSVPYHGPNITLNTSYAGNLKACPSFTDYLTNGFIIPMWTDVIIKYDSSIDKYMWHTASGSFSIDAHHNSQYLDYVEHKNMGQKTYFIFKFPAPWKMITPKGYSTLQLPVSYEFNEDFSAVPGTRDSDIYHNLNIQIAIHTDKKEIFIARGTPLAHFIPYKRTKESIEILEYSEISNIDRLKLKKLELNLTTKFPGSKLYKNEKKKNN